MANTDQKTYYLLHAEFRDGSFLDDFTEEEAEVQQRFYELSQERDCTSCTLAMIFGHPLILKQFPIPK